MNATTAKTVALNLSSAIGSVPINRIDWIFPIAINIFLLLSSTWVFISLLHYGVKTRKWSRTQKSNEEKLNGGLIYSSVVLCAIACLLRYIFALVYMNIGYDYGYDRLCDTFSDITSSFYTFVLFSSALFLWSRQRVFYANRMLNVNYSRPVRFLSQSSIGFILVCGSGVLIFSVIPDDHPSSPDGCTYSVASDNLKIAYWLSIVLVILFGQVTVFYLFVNAIRKASLPTSRNACSSSKNNSVVDCTAEHNNSITVTENGTKRKRSNDSGFNDGKSRRHFGPTRKRTSHVDPIKGILRITFMFALISLFLDILIQAFSFFVSTGHRRVVTTLLNVSSFLNLLLLVFAFKDYKKMLFSCLYK